MSEDGKHCYILATLYLYPLAGIRSKRDVFCELVKRMMTDCWRRVAVAGEVEADINAPKGVYQPYNYELV